MHRIVLRDGVVADGLGLTAAFVARYSIREGDAARPLTFDERDLRLANRGGARIAGAEIAAILERRRRIERALRGIEPGASLLARSVPWPALGDLFDAFADIDGVGFSKVTKTLHPKRPALIPILDSFVQAYLLADEPRASGSFGERAIALVRSYKRDLDRNRAALRTIRRELARGGHGLTEVRILDIVIWSVAAAG